MMEMQGNATEIDERNLLQLDALLSHGYGLSPQLVMRSKGLRGILSLSVFSNQQVTSLVVNLKPRLKTGAPI